MTSRLSLRAGTDMVCRQQADGYLEKLIYESYRNRTALVTGASAGIGEAFATQLAQLGMNLVLVARREERLQSLAEKMRQQHSVSVTVVAADLGEPDACSRIWNTLQAEDISVDMLVNNAGYGVTGTYLSREWPVHEAFMQVMLRSVAELCHLFMPAMVERGWGRVINVASLAGFLPGTNGHTQYAAVKAWMIKFSESLSLELADRGVLTCASCPGFTYSEFHDVTGTREQMKSMPKWMWMTAEEVVDLSLKANQRGKAIVITGRINRFIAFLTKVMPRRAVMWLLRKNSDKFRKVD